MVTYVGQIHEIYGGLAHEIHRRQIHREIHGT